MSTKSVKSELSLAALKVLSCTRNRKEPLNMQALRRILTHNRVRTSRTLPEVCDELVTFGFLRKLDPRTYVRTAQPYTREHANRLQALVQIRRKPAPSRVRATSAGEMSPLWAQMMGFPVRDIEVPLGRVHLLEGDNEA